MHSPSNLVWWYCCRCSRWGLRAGVRESMVRATSTLETYTSPPTVVGCFCWLVICWARDPCSWWRGSTLPPDSCAPRITETKKKDRLIKCWFFSGSFDCGRQFRETSHWAARLTPKGDAYERRAHRKLWVCFRNTFDTRLLTMLHIKRNDRPCLAMICHFLPTSTRGLTRSVNYECAPNAICITTNR